MLLQIPGNFGIVRPRSYAHDLVDITPPSNIRVYSSMSDSYNHTTIFENDEVQLNIYWDDNSDNEDGFRIQEFHSGSWHDVATVGANTTFYAWDEYHAADPNSQDRTLRVGATLGGAVSWSGGVTIPLRAVVTEDPGVDGSGSYPGSSISGHTPYVGDYNWTSWGESSSNEIKITDQAMYAYRTGGSSDDQRAVIETDVPSFRAVLFVTYNSDPATGSPGIIFRATDSSNYFMYTATPSSSQALIQVENGTPTTLASTSGGPLIQAFSSYDLYVKVDGDQFYGIMAVGTLGSSNALTHTLPSFNETATLHGIRGNNTEVSEAQHYFSNFYVYDGPSGNVGIL